MRTRLSLLMITKNAQQFLEQSLQSVVGLVDEMIVIDDFSSDRTIEILQKYKCTIYQHHEIDRGIQMAFGLKKSTHEWIFVLDSDEVVSPALKKEIFRLLDQNLLKSKGYLVPFQNYFLGKRLSHGGEFYKKMILFKKSAVTIKPALIHQKFELKTGKPAILQNVIHHFSYPSVRYLLHKFTFYGKSEAKQKIKDGESTSLKKILLNPPHMFWARFIKDKGYKDGLFRIPLDIGFAYMEFVTYFSMLFIKNKKR